MAHETRPNWYGRRWRKRRAAQLAAFPFCAMCLDERVFTVATVADHIEPHRFDPVKFWDGALQSLCKRHHDRDKQLLEAGTPLLGVDADGWPVAKRSPFEERRFPSDIRPSAIPLTMVCGRPGSGKSTYVREHAAPGDTVIDLDLILASLSGEPEHAVVASRWLGPALEVRNRCLRALQSATAGRAWFVISAPDPGERQLWAERLGAELVVLETPLAECIRRIRADPARAGRADAMVRAAREWRGSLGGVGAVQKGSS
jgi:5-methylcytosine-specific restriction protein A